MAYCIPSFYINRTLIERCSLWDMASAVSMTMASWVSFTVASGEILNQTWFIFVNVLVYRFVADMLTGTVYR